MPDLSYLNADTEALLLDFEVGGGQKNYEKRSAHPVWPGGSSGITIGVGYDLGQVSAAQFRRDWAALPDADRTVLETTVGKTGKEAQAVLATVKAITVPWDAAYQVFRDVSVPSHWAATVNAFPNVEKMPPHIQGALLSLVYNRGASMSGDRRKEMRDIREAVKANQPEKIPGLLRDMERVWKGTDIEKGMVRRREAEAALAEKGLVPVVDPDATGNPEPQKPLDQVIHDKYLEPQMCLVSGQPGTPEQASRISEFARSIREKIEDGFIGKTLAGASELVAKQSGDFVHDHPKVTNFLKKFGTVIGVLGPALGLAGTFFKKYGDSLGLAQLAGPLALLSGASSLLGVVTNATTSQDEELKKKKEADEQMVRDAFDGTWLGDYLERVGPKMKMAAEVATAIGALAKIAAVPLALTPAGPALATASLAFSVASLALNPFKVLVPALKAWAFTKNTAKQAWNWTKGIGSKIAGGARQAWGFAKSLPGRATSFASRMAGKFGAWALPDSTEIHSGRATRDGGVTGPFLPGTWSREALEIELLKFHKMGPEAAADELLGSGSAAIFVNGVHYPLDLHCRAAQEMADTYGVPIVGVWNASGKGHDIMGIKGTGFLRDWGQSVTDKMFSGFGMKVNPATETLKNLILKHGSPKSENGGLRILAHSQGTIITSEALRLARAEGAVLNDRIDVTTFGNAIHSMPTGVHDRHYVHQKDVIAASVGSGAGIATYLGPINPALALGAAVADRYSPRFYDKVVSRFNPVGWGMNLLGKVFPSIGAHQATAPKTKIIEYPGGTRGPLSVEQHGLVWDEGAKSSYVQNTKNDVIQQWAARGYKGKAELQRSGWGDAPDVDAGALRQRLRKQGGLGLTVPAAVKAKLRPFLGFDPFAARIHTGPTAAEAASQLHAEAFTIGRDVFFGKGQYSPNTKEGLGLLGHELTHVGQQMGRSFRPQFFTHSGGDSMEAEAQTVGRRIASMAFSQDGDLQVDRFDLEVSLEDSFDRQAVDRAEVIAATALDIARRRCSSVTLADTVLEQLHIEVELDLNVDSDSEAAQRVADSILEALAQNASGTAGPEVGSETSQAPVEEGSDSDGLPEDWEGEPIVQASRKVPKPRGGGWKVVVVGSPSPAETESATDRRRLQFLNAAASQGKDKQTIWLVEGSGYRAGKIPESEIKRMSKGVAWMEFVEPGESLVEALNRFRLKSISSLNVYSHGLRGLVALRYGWGDALPDYGLTVDQIASLNPNVFAKNAKIRFDSCNTGVAGLDENTSVAQAFSDRTGADVQAWTGRTSYADLNRGKGGVRGSELSWSSDAFKELWSRTVSGGSPKLKTFHPRRSGIDSFSPGAVPTYGFTPVPPPFGPSTLKEPLKKETGQSPKVAEAPVSRTMAQNAESLTSTYSSKKVEYQMGAQYSDENLKSDCSHFVHDVLVKSGYEIPYQSTSMMSGSKYYDKTDSPVAGDVMVQGGHMGVYSGTEDDKGNPQGYQMGNSGAKLGSWGPKGWFNKDKDLIYYRPKSEYLKKSGGTQ